MTLKSYTVFQILSFFLGVIMFIPQAPELNSLLKWNINISFRKGQSPIYPIYFWAGNF